MLYGIIAERIVSYVGVQVSGQASFAGAGNLFADSEISTPGLITATALLNGSGALSANPYLNMLGRASFAGAGNMRTLATIQTSGILNATAAFVGAGNMTVDLRNPLLVADWEFDENTGGTAGDNIGGNTGTLVGSPTWVTGHTGSALSFNGTSQSVSVGTFDPIPAGTVGSISVWIKPSDFTNGVNHYVIAKGSDIDTNSWGLDIIGDGTDAGVYIVYYTSSTSAHYVDAVIPNDDNLHHVVSIFGATADRKIYVDNVDQSLSTIGTPPSTHVSNAAAGLNIAKTTRGSPNTYFYAGVIDNLKIFNCALTADQVAALYNS